MIRALLVVVLLLVSGPAHAELRQVVLFHTSDVHGGLTARTARWHKANPKRQIGGYAALMNVVKREKLPHVLLDSGDIFQGTPEGNLTRGDAVVAAMNAVGYGAMVIGNHEYDFGEANLKRLIGMAQFPVLGANIRLKASGARVD